MKKLLSMTLILALVLGLCACGGATAPAESDTPAQGLQVGYARKEIMPQDSVPMAGYSDSSQRMSTGYLGYLYVTCIAFSEADETVLMFSQDLFKCDAQWTAEVREKITADTGIPGDKIILCATRNHGGPDISSANSAITAYKTLYMDAVAAAAKEALEDRAAATLYTTVTQTQSLNFPRHYTLSNDTYGGDNFGDLEGNTITGYANAGDPDMLLIKADRDGDKKDILIMNWQAYPCVIAGSTDTSLSADFIGKVRDAVEKQTDMQFAYFTGAAGDLKPTSKIPSDNVYFGGDEYGNALAKCAVDALAGMTKLEGSGIKTSRQSFEYAMNHEDEDMLPQAREVVQMQQDQGLDAAKALAKQYGFRSYYHAMQVTQRVTRTQTGTMEMNVVSVGGMAFVAAPYEMFHESGIYIRRNSPFATTVICSCANEYQGNFATETAYDYGSYESDINPYAKGCAEAAADKLVEMLKSLQ